MKNLILFLMLTFLFAPITQAQITRGAQPGEIYISGDWYIENNSILHYAILRSIDNGENISLQYENIETPPPGAMKVGKVLGDATPGALYNYGNNELWVSFNYGQIWEFRGNIGTDNRYSSGTTEGEIYKYCKNPTSLLYRSTDFGHTFEEINSGVFGFPEVGTNEGDFYMLTGATWPTFYIEILFSYDFGYTFSTIEIDSSIYGYYLSGMFPIISRGTEPEELYLVSWWPEYHYKIFHSVDTGYTWTERYESDYIDIYYWSVQFTAGREPGSFYVLRARINPAGDHVWLYIDYSSDYGQTFTTYFHDLDSLFTSVEPIQKQDFEINAYPNPFSGTTKILYNVENKAIIQLNIYNYIGQLIKSIDEGTQPKGTHFIEFNANGLKDGIYLYSIMIDGKSTDSKKMTIMN